MIFLKLGGSLITDKGKISTPRRTVLRRVASEISEAMQRSGGFPLVLGHGSGSFGHPVAERYQIAFGVERPDQWRGFAEVWSAANQLNRIVVDSLLEADLRAVSFPPSASAICEAGDIVTMSVEPIEGAIAAGLIPVVQGDVAFDRVQGATVVSTEKVFRFLASYLKPSSVLLAGIEKGVYQDFSRKETILSELSQAVVNRLEIGASQDVDVTGGMLNKVREALEISRSHRECSVRIFSGLEPGVFREALLGEPVGTLVKHSP
jgi:isopentenyl phosphate kinase